MRSDVPSSRPLFRRATALGILVALAASLLVTPIFAAATTVTGSLAPPEGVVLTPQAVAIVTIVDHAASTDAGAVVGEQRIDDATARPARLLRAGR